MDKIKKISHRKVWVAVFIVLALGYGVYLSKEMKTVPIEDLSMRAENILSSLENSSELLLRTQGKGAVFISSEETRVFLAENLKEWEGINPSPATLAEGDLILYLNLAEDYKVIFYGSDSMTAKIQHQNHYRYFKIPKGTYEKMAFDYSIRSYLVPEPIMNAIGEGKLSEVESLNETPVNTNYTTAQIGNFTYYFYHKYGKYYVEAPYFFVKELSKKAYEEAVSAIPQ